MKKMVLKLVIEDERSKRKAMKAIAGVEGVESVAVDMKEKKITVIGEADPVFLTVKLRKFGFGFTELLSVGPAKEEKKPEAAKKEEKKEEKKPDPPQVVYLNPSSYPPYPYTVVTEDYNPNTCTIC